MTVLLNRIFAACSWPGRIVGWLILPLIASVCLTVLAAQLGLNVLAEWGVAVPVFGKALTVNSLLDLQWHIFALIVLFGGIYAYRDNTHVSVDVFSSALPERSRLIVRTIGDLIFLLPFCIIIAWYGTSFAEKAFMTGEGSTYGGLMDRWLIKAAIPVSFTLLGISAVIRAVLTLRRITEMRGETPFHE